MYQRVANYDIDLFLYNNILTYATLTENFNLGPSDAICQGFLDNGT